MLALLAYMSSCKYLMRGPLITAFWNLMLALLSSISHGLAAASASRGKEWGYRDQDSAGFFEGLKFGYQNSETILFTLFQHPPNVPLLEALSSLLDGIWGFLKGS